MGLKIYVAGKLEDKDRVRVIQAMLRNAGHEITVDWTTNSQNSRVQAIKDLRGVADADILVAVFEKDLPYKGTYVELGAALALGKPVYILGPNARKCIFLKHPNVRQGEDAFNRDLILGLL